MSASLTTNLCILSHCVIGLVRGKKFQLVRLLVPQLQIHQKDKRYKVQKIIYIYMYFTTVEPNLTLEMKLHS